MESKTDISWFLIPLIVFVLMRAALLLALYLITNGSEFAMDWFSFDLGLKPFSVLTFQNEISGYSQPPLYPMAIAPLAIPLSKILNNFLASRITFIILEFIMFGLMIKYLGMKGETVGKYKNRVLLVLALSPLGLMVSTIMRQEEAITAIFLVAVLIAYQRGSVKTASLLTFLGIITAKILFGVTFLALLLHADNKKDVFKWGIAPTAIFYIIYLCVGYLVSGNLPLLGFSPESVVFCTSIYSFLLRFMYLSGPFMKWSSLLLLGLSYWFMWLRRGKFKRSHFPLTLMLVYFLLYLIFYHINTDYYIYVLPLLAIIPFSEYGKIYKRSYLILHCLLGIFSWGFGIVYGLRIYGNGFGFRSASKDMLMGVYGKIFGAIQIYYLEIFLLALTIVVLLLLTITLFRNIFSNRELSKLS